LNDGDVPSASIDWRRPDYAVASLVAGGRHELHGAWISWDASVARSRFLQAGGNGGASFSWNGGDTNCVDSPSTTKTADRPQFSAGCFAPGTGNNLDINNYKLKSFTLPSVGQSVQLNLQGSAAYGRYYRVGRRYGTFEFGAKVRNGHKFDDAYTLKYTTKSGLKIGVGQFAGNFFDSNYYDNSYPSAPKNADYEKVQSYVLGNLSQFTYSGGPGPNSADYDLIERVSAGYLMNSIDLTSRLRLVTGVRFENTSLSTLAYEARTKALTYKGSGNYLDVLPSASLRYALDSQSGVRLVYSRALSRPNPQDIAQSVGPVNDTQTPPTVSLGNPNLKAEHADNVDLLYERYLKPLGLIQAGFFYKNLTDPIVATQTKPTTGPFAGYLVSQPGNAGSADLYGFEIAYQQRLSFLPGRLAGFGISANYSYTTSQAYGIPGRTDSPALLRQAPNTWNISPTYDRGRLSVRVGMSFNQANIYAYQYQNLDSNGKPLTGSDLTAGGVKGPGGDNYLYSHYQLDVQGTYRLMKGFTAVVYGLNLNNEVFGFYNGSVQYVVQREYYKPSFGFGLRWSPTAERK
jgi:TonB-dependent receptor